VTYPDMYGAWFLVAVLMLVTPLLVLVVVAWLVGSSKVSDEDTAMRVARQTEARRQIDKEQLGVMLNAL
jgi:uncharacterized membrane protein